MYMQRYLPHFPAAGEVIIFDRSWYNRAGVEQVMGFCTPEESRRFLELVPGVERAMADAGILLLKYWLEVSPDEQTRRLQSRIDDPRKTWKLSEMDLLSYQRWSDYSRARDQMFAATDTAWAPWWVVNSDDKKKARLNVIAHLLDRIPYEPIEHHDVELPHRQEPRRRARRGECPAAPRPDQVLTDLSGADTRRRSGRGRAVPGRINARRRQAGRRPGRWRSGRQRRCPGPAVARRPSGCLR